MAVENATITAEEVHADLYKLIKAYVKEKGEEMKKDWEPYLAPQAQSYALQAADQLSPFLADLLSQTNGK